jgi:hypothetical protein
MITGIKPYAAIAIALPSKNDCRIRMCITIKTTNTNVAVKEMMNLQREYFVFDSKTGTNTSTYPIRMPMQAVRNHDRSPVYTAQENKSKQTDRYVETVNARSFLDPKKQVTVGTNV